MKKSAPLSPLRLPERLAESLVNARSHVVLGARLLPFCLWHRTLFDLYGLPWGRQPKKGELSAGPTLTHLLAAVQICRTRYGERPDLAGVFGVHTLWQKLRLRWRLRQGLDFGFLAFGRYLEDHCAPPELWEVKRGRPGTGKAPADARPPGALAVATRLIGCGFSEHRAWEMPEGLAHWYSATAFWLAGEEVPFVTESDETLDFVRKLQERAKRRKAAKKAKEKPDA